MSFRHPSRLLLVFMLATSAVAAGEPAAFPASLKNACPEASCSTLTDEHHLTFVSRLSFPFGSAQLTREAQHELLRMLTELESYAVISHVEIIGHADPSGPENYNRWITEVRATRVADYFRQSGVDPRKLAIRGAGSGEPLAGAIDDAEHRRIEIRITLQPFL